LYLLELDLALGPAGVLVDDLFLCNSSSTRLIDQIIYLTLCFEFCYFGLEPQFLTVLTWDYYVEYYFSAYNHTFEDVVLPVHPHAQDASVGREHQQFASHDDSVDR
jgi:hypothetical protein